MKISILAPTRERVYHVERLLSSIKNTAFDFNNFEILFAYDYDDIITGSYLENILERYPDLHIEVHGRERADFLNRDYYNWLAYWAKGDYLWLIGDDIMFMTEHWDKILIEKVEEYLKNKKDGIVYVSIRDNTIPTEERLPDFACFPCISRKAVEKLGFFMPPQIPSWSSDYYIYLLYSGIGRVLEINNINLQHVSSHSNMVSEDESTFKQRRLHKEYNVDDLLTKLNEEELPILKGRLIEYIKKVNRL